ncbi:twin-arginine translocase TatA/TatE family subunit [bacterium]|nr:twin-arginine translocase TatA/TatE family subunit [bacterium]MBU1918771.1 twin-arginine translocase TatA/TatE family subunit [bacterium]
MILGIGSIGVPELLVVLVIGIFIFGAKKIPEIGSGLGKAIRSFNKGVKGEDEENKKDK